ncbi:MAG: 50S ribosomal protein L24 [Candidatus Marsarchaeota archaeon]|jgi:large subunit ribosomal protein L24|nr:50S ribosomal protein L24 [Candidatus Marsarchaeota archaeon]
MIKSAKPRKQRKYRMTAPLHERQHFLHSHLDKALRQRLGIKARSVRVSKGDTIKLMSGAKKGTSGKVTAVELSTGRIVVDSLVRKNARGKERSVKVSASNVYITDLNLEDKFRASKLGLQVQKKKPEEKANSEKNVKAKAGNAADQGEKKVADVKQGQEVAQAIVPAQETK